MPNEMREREGHEIGGEDHKKKGEFHGMQAYKQVIFQKGRNENRGLESNGRGERVCRRGVKGRECAVARREKKKKKGLGESGEKRKSF